MGNKKKRRWELPADIRGWVMAKFYGLYARLSTKALNRMVEVNAAIFVIILLLKNVPGFNAITFVFLDEVIQCVNVFLAGPSMAVLRDRKHEEARATERRARITELYEDVYAAVRDELRERQDELAEGAYIKVTVEEIAIKKGRKMDPVDLQVLHMACKKLVENGDWAKVQPLNEGRHPVIHLMPSEAQLERIREGRTGDIINFDEAQQG